MTNAKFDKFGAWKPFQVPVPLPTALSTDEPLVSLCVNDEWATYISGAMYALYREQTWDSSTQEDIDAARYQIADLLVNWDEGCGGGTVPDWQFINVVSDGITWAEMKFPTPFVSAQSANFVGYSALVISDSLPVEPVDFTIYQRSYSGGLDVGVKITDFRIATGDSDGALHVAITDCLDNLTTVDDFGHIDYPSVFPLDAYKSIKTIQVTSDGTPIFISVKGFDVWQCGPA